MRHPKKQPFAHNVPLSLHNRLARKLPRLQRAKRSVGRPIHNSSKPRPVRRARMLSSMHRCRLAFHHRANPHHHPHLRPPIIRASSHFIPFTRQPLLVHSQLLLHRVHLLPPLLPLRVRHPLLPLLIHTSNNKCYSYLVKCDKCRGQKWHSSKRYCKIVRRKVTHNKWRIWLMHQECSPFALLFCVAAVVLSFFWFSLKSRSQS